MTGACGGLLVLVPPAVRVRHCCVTREVPACCFQEGSCRSEPGGEGGRDRSALCYLLSGC